MSDDPREATAGDGMSAERREEIRRQLSHAGAGWIDDVEIFPGTSETRFCNVTLGELKQLLDDSSALQAAREQLDEARRRVSELEQQNDEDYQQAQAAVREAEDAIAFMKQLAGERDAARAELKAANEMLRLVDRRLHCNCGGMDVCFGRPARFVGCAVYHRSKAHPEDGEYCTSCELNAYLATRGAGGAQGEE